MGWLGVLVLALVIFAGMWRYVSADRAAMQFLAAALLLALAGYAWQGRPGFAGVSKAAPERQEIPRDAFNSSREDMLGRFDRAWAWLNLAESYQRRGDTQGGAQILQSAVRQEPRNVELWVGLGNALVVHGDGMMNPAAQLAFGQAERLAPGHPGPRYFYGLALGQGGNFAEAERIWQELLADPELPDQYRAAIEQQLPVLRNARTRSGPPGPPPASDAPAP